MDFGTIGLAILLVFALEGFKPQCFWIEQGIQLPTTGHEHGDWRRELPYRVFLTVDLLRSAGAGYFSFPRP